MIPESPGTFAARCRVADPLVLLAFQSLAIDAVQVCDLRGFREGTQQHPRLVRETYAFGRARAGRQCAAHPQTALVEIPAPSRSSGQNTLTRRMVAIEPNRAATLCTDRPSAQSRPEVRGVRISESTAQSLM